MSQHAKPSPDTPKPKKRIVHRQLHGNRLLRQRRDRDNLQEAIAAPFRPVLDTEAFFKSFGAGAFKEPFFG